MAEPTVIASYVVELLTDGSIRHVGFNAEPSPGEPDSHTEAIEVIQATLGPVEVLDPSESLSGPSVTDQLGEYIRHSPSHDALAQLWRDNKDLWTAEHNKLAANRKKELGK